MKKRIFEEFKLAGFKSLVRSSDLLRKFMTKIGLIGGGGPETIAVSQKELVSNIIGGGGPEIIVAPQNELVSDLIGGGGPEESVINSIRVQLGKAQRIFNPMDDYHIFEFIDEFETVVSNK